MLFGIDELESSNNRADIYISADRLAGLSTVATGAELFLTGGGAIDLSHTTFVIGSSIDLDNTTNIVTLAATGAAPWIIGNDQTIRSLARPSG